jgi:LDH2 family malate/lactate/ureidoglycolate dehydrogenase
VTPDEVRVRIRALGYSEPDTALLADHFLDAERRGKLGHGLARVDWLATLPDLDPAAKPECVSEHAGFEHWDGRGALGYLTLGAICQRLVERPPQPARVVTASNCFPTGMLGYWVRRLAEAGLAALLTATSPPRLPHPEGGPPLVGTIPIAIGIPSAGSEPIVADVSMAKATYGDVLAGRATADDLVAFGGAQAHKSFALALGLQLLVQAAAGDDGYGAFLVVLAPEFDPVPELRARAAGLHLPGDR